MINEILDQVFGIKPPKKKKINRGAVRRAARNKAIRNHREKREREHRKYLKETEKAFGRVSTDIHK